MNEGGMSEYDSDAMDKAIPIDNRRNTKKKNSLGGKTQTSSRGAEAPPTVSHRGSPKTAIHF